MIYTLLHTNTLEAKIIFSSTYFEKNGEKVKENKLLLSILLASTKARISVLVDRVKEIFSRLILHEGRAGSVPRGVAREKKAESIDFLSTDRT